MHNLNPKYRGMTTADIYKEIVQSDNFSGPASMRLLSRAALRLTLLLSNSSENDGADG